jgi:tripartite-type tricarboxylate transporter receptor subunit TctC
MRVILSTDDKDGPRPSRRAVIGAGAAFALMGSSSLSWGNDFPNKPMRILLGFAAGAATDTMARAVAQGLNTRLGQPVVVENRPGASTRIAMEAVQKADADGYTLGLAAAVTTAFPLMFDGVTFAPGKEFVPIAMLARAPMFLAVRKDFPAKDFKEFAEYAKGRSITFGHQGKGGNPHIAGLALGRSVGAKVVEVPYRGGGPIATALGANDVDYAMLEYAAVRSMVDAGLVRLLLVTEPKRTSLQPDIPSLREANATQEVEGLCPWFMLIAPAETPKPILTLLGKELDQVVETEAYKTMLVANGVDADRRNTEEATRYFLEQRTRVGKLAADLGIDLKI